MQTLTTQPPRRTTPDRPLAIDAHTPMSLLRTLHRGYAFLADLERHETVPASARLTPAQRAEWPLIAAELRRRGEAGEGGVGAWAA